MWQSAGGYAARGGTAVAQAARLMRIWPAAFGSGGRSAQAGGGAGGSSEAGRQAAVEFFYFLCSQLFRGCFIAHEIICSYFVSLEDHEITDLPGQLFRGFVIFIGMLTKLL
jgi:hypothetical protein